MAEDLNDLLNLFFASDGRRNLVSSRETIQRNSEVFQIRWKLKLLPVLFFFLLALLHLCSHVFHDRFGVRPHVSQDFDEQTVVTAQSFKDVCCFNCFAALISRALHRTLEQICCVRADTKSLTDMLLPAVAEAFLNRHFDDDRVER